MFSLSICKVGDEEANITGMLGVKALDRLTYMYKQAAPRALLDPLAVSARTRRGKGIAQRPSSLSIQRWQRKMMTN